MVDAASEAGFVPAGRGGARPFDHHVADLGDVRLHYVTAGQGDPLVLLAGFPQSWYAWRKVIPRLAERFRVIAIDLPGQGDSSKPESGYDTKAMAAVVHRLIERLGVGPVYLAAHDVGAWVAYPLAAGHPSAVRAVALLEAGIPGVALPYDLPVRAASGKMFHFLFHLLPDFPEQLIAGREREYVSWFLRAKAFDPGDFTEADIDEYTRCFAAPGGVRAGLGWYRAVPLDADQNRELAARPLGMPVLGIGGRYGSTPDIGDDLRKVARHVETETLDDCGHYPPEEQPAAVAGRLLRFFSHS